MVAPAFKVSFAQVEKAPPGVRFIAFGSDGLQFELRAWSSQLLDRKGRLLSQLNFGIYERFTAAGIVFPLPQRDLHIKSGVLEVRQVGREPDDDRAP